MRKIFAAAIGLILLAASAAVANDFPDLRPYTKVTDASSLTLDCTAYKGFYITVLTTNTSLTLANLQTDKGVLIEVKQASSGGPYTVSFTNTIKWQGGTTYTASTTASAKDMVRCIKDADGD